MKAPFLIGRVLFGGFFLWNGVEHFRKTESMAQYARAKGVPQPQAAVLATGVALTLGGASILLGIKPKAGSAALLGFLAGVTPVMHDYWKSEDPKERAGEEANFYKNLALAGAAVALAGVEEPWPVSVPVKKRRGFERLSNLVKRSIAA